MKYYFLLLCILFGCATTPEKEVLRHIPRSDRSDMVVLNFKNSTAGDGADKYQPWELGLASMMMTDLEKIGLYNIISSKDVKTLSRGIGITDPGKNRIENDPLNAGKIVSAKYVLSGSFIEMGGQLRIEVRVINVKTEHQIGVASVLGITEDFFNLQKQLVIKVSDFLETFLNQQEVSAIKEEVETTSVNASLNNYAGEIAVLRAEEYRGRGQKKIAASYEEKAKENFRKALSIDPDYERAKRNLAQLVKGLPMTL
jgi:TolB-like protein